MSYPKIPHDTREWPKAYKRVAKWAVTEKVHGANFAFIVCRDTITYGKRSGVISADESFFNYQSMLPDTLPQVRAIVAAVLADRPLRADDDATVIVYGELFGGLYPNCPQTTMPVQRGVYYSPNIHFYAFDICVDQDGRRTYLPYEQAARYFQASGILYAEPLAVFASYEQAAHFKIGGNSTIPAKLHLPALPCNKAEGIVIRSMTERFLVKVKIPEFAEESAHVTNNAVDTRDKRAIAAHLMTENRLNNAISKVGPLDDYRYQIYTEYCRDICSELRVTDPHERKTLMQELMAATIQKFGAEATADAAADADATAAADADATAAA